MVGIGIGISPMLSRSGGAAPVAIGTIINNDFNSDNWTQIGTGTTWTFNTGIDSVGTSETFTSLIRYNQWYTAAEEWTFTSRIKINSVTASDKLFFEGLRGVSTFSSINSIYSSVWCSADPANGLLTMWVNGGNVAQSVPKLVVAEDDVLEFVFVRSFQTFTFTARNITNPTSDLSISYAYPNNFVYPSFLGYPNIAQPAYFNYRGDYTVQSFSFALNNYKNCDLVIVGDSKSQGFYADALSNRFASLWAAANPTKYINCNAGDGNVTQDVLNNMDELLLYNSRKVILYIGRNDLANAVPSGTWQANYASIVSQLEAIGCQVWHQLPTTETVLDQSALTTYINSNYTNIISVPATWNAATDNGGDGIHPNQAGNLKIYNNQILSITI